MVGTGGESPPVPIQLPSGTGGSAARCSGVSLIDINVASFPERVIGPSKGGLAANPVCHQATVRLKLTVISNPCSSSIEDGERLAQVVVRGVRWAVDLQTSPSLRLRFEATADSHRFCWMTDPLTAWCRFTCTRFNAVSLTVATGI